MKCYILDVGIGTETAQDLRGISMTGELVSTLLSISALGIYIHAFFLSISLGFPFVIISLLFKYWRTKDRDYADATRTVTSVLGLNFALGAITGTLVEFGLVQAWPGTIFAIATFAFIPLTMELIAFIGEIVTSNNIHCNPGSCSDFGQYRRHDRLCCNGYVVWCTYPNCE